MAARRGAIKNWSEYVVVAGLIGLAQMAPAAVLLGLARRLSRLARWTQRDRCRRTAARVQSCLGLEPGDPRVDSVIEGAFYTLGLNGIEPIIVERMLESGSSPHDFISIEGGEHLERALKTGKGLLLCGGHLGSWELIPFFLSRLYVPIWGMARPLANPLLERYLAARRLRCVRGMVPKDGGGLKLARLMRAGECLGLLLDQNAGSQGVILDFMGLPSSHHTVSGVMAQRFGALAIPIYLIREPQLLRYRLVIEPPIAADPNLPAAEAELDVVRRLSLSLEARVRANPEQWNWLHDRWRHALHVLGKPGRGAAPSQAEHTQVPIVQGTNGA